VKKILGIMVGILLIVYGIAVAFDSGAWDSWRSQLLKSGIVTKTIKKTIGGIGVVADFNFVTAANTSEQVIDLGAIIPARARIIDVCLITDATFTGATTLVADVGNASGGAQFIASATIYAANAVLPVAAAGACPVAPNVAATHVYVNATPGANWSNVTAGKVSVYITYIDVTSM